MARALYLVPLYTTSLRSAQYNSNSSGYGRDYFYIILLRKHPYKARVLTAYGTVLMKYSTPAVRHYNVKYYINTGNTGTGAGGARTALPVLSCCTTFLFKVKQNTLHVMWHTKSNKRLQPAPLVPQIRISSIHLLKQRP